MPTKQSDIQNVTEPIVIVESTITSQEIIMQYVNTDMSDESNTANYHENTQINDVFINGISFPLIYFNGIILDQQNLESFALWHNDFIPQMDIVVYDYLDNLKLTGGVGASNSVVLKLMAPIDGIYKKIELNFYINNSESLGGNRYKFVCLYKNITLDKTVCGTIKLDDKYELTTFELCKAIAQDTGMGFAATENCEAVTDTRPRRSYSSTYKDLLKNHINFGGTNENELFDCFVDLYNNITLIQVPWVFEEAQKLNVTDLQIMAILGDSVNADIGGSTTNFLRAEKMPKILTNNKNADADVPNNLCIGSLTKLSKPGYIVANGALTTCNFFNPAGVGSGMNNITTKQVQQKGNSVDDDDVSNYASEKTVTCQIEFNELPTGYQQALHKNYFKKLRADQVEVELSRPNYGLTRGTLVFILDDHDDILNATKEMSMITNDLDNNDENVPKDIIFNDRVQVVNIGTSDFYYIDKVNFFYNKGDQEIRQHLILSKVNYALDLRQLELLNVANKEINTSTSNDTIGNG